MSSIGHVQSSGLSDSGWASWVRAQGPADECFRIYARRVVVRIQSTTAFSAAKKRAHRPSAHDRRQAALRQTSPFPGAPHFDQQGELAAKPCPAPAEWLCAFEDAAPF